MITSGNRYIGGGKLYFTPKGGQEVEIGEVQEVAFSINTETADAFSKSNVMKKLVEKVVTSINATLKFTTQKFDIDNVAMAMLGKVEDKVFQTSEKLPDGTTATKEETIKVIKIGKNPLITGKFKFIGDEDGAHKPVLEIFEASVMPTGDISYISENHATLQFEGAVLETENGFAEEYRMKVGE